MARFSVSDLMLRGGKYVLYGDGEQVRDFTYVSDVAAATVAASIADVPAAAVFNVAGGASSTVNGVLGLVAENVGRDVLIARELEQAGDVRVTGGAIDRARQILGWEPAIPLEEGIKRQVAYQLGGNHTRR